MNFALLAVPMCVVYPKGDNNIIMIWHCGVCITWNANINNDCILCGIQSTHKGDDNDCIVEYLDIVIHYMKAEVDNRITNFNEQLNVSDRRSR